MNPFSIIENFYKIKEFGSCIIKTPKFLFICELNF